MESIDPQHDKTAVLTAFEEFRTDLDDYNDRRERLIKVFHVSVYLLDVSTDP
jgi:hypothetical protein